MKPTCQHPNGKWIQIREKDREAGWCIACLDCGQVETVITYAK